MRGLYARCARVNRSEMRFCGSGHGSRTSVFLLSLKIIVYGTRGPTGDSEFTPLKQLLQHRRGFVLRLRLHKDEPLEARRSERQRLQLELDRAHHAIIHSIITLHESIAEIVVYAIDDARLEHWLQPMRSGGRYHAVVRKALATQQHQCANRQSRFQVGSQFAEEGRRERERIAINQIGFGDGNVPQRARAIKPYIALIER